MTDAERIAKLQAELDAARQSRKRAVWAAQYWRRLYEICFDDRDTITGRELWVKEVLEANHD